MAGTPGDGSVLKVTISASPTAIAKNTKFGPVKMNRSEVDYTGLADTFQTFQVVARRKSDPIAFSGFWDASNATHAYLLTSYDGGLTEVWTALYADTGACTISWSGYLTELEIGEATVDSMVMINGVIRPTTVFTVTP